MIISEVTICTLYVSAVLLKLWRKKCETCIVVLGNDVMTFNLSKCYSQCSALAKQLKKARYRHEQEETKVNVMILIPFVQL